jgi:hypothetical protein
LVLRYSYLWATEKAAGKDDGRKDRPALVLAVAVVDDGGETQVLVLAITHAPPARQDDAVELPAAIKRQLQLDRTPSWIVTTEANAFFWPGPDIRPIPGRTPPTAIYGTVPASLMKRVAISYLANRKRQMLVRRGR